MKTNYLSTVYNPESHPYTTYPEKLCKHLYDRFNFDKEMSLLEVGCGRGEFLRNFKNLGLSVYGCDLSDEVKDYLKDFDIKITDVDKQPLPYNDNSIDIIFSKSFIEHLYYPENFLKEAMRILKPGGLLLTLTPDWESNYKIFFDDFTHRSPFTKTALKDAYKMDVYAMSNWRNNNYNSLLSGTDGPAVPVNSIKKEPSAELNINQRDQDSLPPYEILDEILKKIIEEEASLDSIINLGHDKDLVYRINKLLLLSEYKRRQSAPGVKLTARSFGKERRYPITNAFLRDK